MIKQKKKVLLVSGIIIGVLLVAFVAISRQKNKYVDFDGREEIIIKDRTREADVLDKVTETITDGEYIVVAQEDMIDISAYINKEIVRLDRKIVIGFFGIDKWANAFGRSDVIMLLVYDNVQERVTMISVPRDTLVTIPEYYDDKINHAYAFGEVALASATLEELFQVKLDYYFVTDFNDFEHIVDLMGGVFVNATKAYGYDGEVVIESGEQVLNGTDALIYCRFRSDNEGDFGRMKRQQEVLSSLGEQVGTFDESTLEDLLNEIYYDYLDTNMTIGEMLGYAVESRGNYPVDQYTLKTTSKVIDGIWYELYDEEDLLRLQEIVKKGD